VSKGTALRLEKFKSKWSKLYRRGCGIFEYRGMQPGLLSSCGCGVLERVTQMCSSNLAWVLSHHRSQTVPVACWCGSCMPAGQASLNERVTPIKSSHVIDMSGVNRAEWNQASRVAGRVESGLVGPMRPWKLCSCPAESTGCSSGGSSPLPQPCHSPVTSNQRTGRDKLNR